MGCLLLACCCCLSDSYEYGFSAESNANVNMVATTCRDVSLGDVRVWEVCEV